MSARPHRGAYVLTCDGIPAGSCQAQWFGLPGQDLDRCRKVAPFDGWLCKYGDLCPKCVRKALEK